MKKSKLTSELLSSAKLATWLKTNQNVLFEGKHGVGKTSMILSAIKHAGLKYLYFSGATMDPFIDFIGVPVKVGTKHGEVIKLLRPEHLINCDAHVIVIDEFNRTHKKVRNAVMELIQFKTINGQPLSKNLRMVWAAINPDNVDGGENDYDTDRLDPAQRDRFQVHVRIPYACSLDYFTKKYGDKTAATAIKWWNLLDDKIRDKVSPRRLDYALHTFKHHGDLRDVLPPESNVSNLIQLLKNKGQTLDDLFASRSTTKISEFFDDENNYSLHIDELLKTRKFHKFVYLLPAEKISKLLFSKDTYSVMKKIVVKGLMNKIQRTAYAPILNEKIALSTGMPMNGQLHWAKRMVKRFRLAPKIAKPKVAKGKGLAAIPKPASSLGMLLKLLLQTTSKQRESMLRKQLSAARLKNITKQRMQNLMRQAKRWLKKNGFTVLLSTTDDGITVS